jgi:signal transduction histidine kinase
VKYPTFITVLLFAIQIVAQSSDPGHINVINKKLSEHLIQNQGVFSQKEKAYDIHYVLEHPEVFDWQHKKMINQGIDNKHHWIRIDLENDTPFSEFIYEFNQTNIDSLLLYLVRNDSIIKQYPTKGLHFSQNNVPSYLSNKYAYIYPIDFPPFSKMSIYVRASVNDDAFRVMNKVWNTSGYEKREKQIKEKSGYMLIFLGFVALICLISLAMFGFTKQRLYLYYMGFVLVIIFNLMALRHFVSPLIFERYLFFGNNFVEMFGYLQLFFVLLYTNHFFDLDKRYPKTYRTFKYMAILTAVLFVMALFLRKYEWFFHFSYVFSKFVLIAVSLGLYFFAIYLSFKREIMAYYYVLAYFPLFLFVGHFILTAMKLTDSYNPLEWEYVIFIEITVLTIAMAHRYYLIMKENYQYQKALIAEQERGIHAMIDAQENERSRIAKDLHDGVVQEIGSVILKSRVAFENLKIADSKEAQEILDKLESSNQDLRTISHQMMPRSLKELGLIATLGDMLADSLVPAKIDYNFEHFNWKERIKPIIEINIYRIAQELVNNIIKHSAATSVNVQLIRTGNSVILIIEDNGKGIKSTSSKTGIGLMNIKNRAEMMHGTVTFENGPEGGTLVTLKIEMHEN